MLVFENDGKPLVFAPVSRQFVIRCSRRDLLSTTAFALVNKERFRYNTESSKFVFSLLDDCEGRMGVGKVSVASLKRESVPPNNVERAAEIFSEYGDFILSVIYHRTSNHAQVDDLFQNFFLSLISRPIPLDVQNVKSYLYRAITNDVIDTARRVKNYQALMHKYAESLNYSVNKNAPEIALAEAEEINKTFKLIEGSLPRSEAQAITFRYRDNCNIKEIAEKMNINYGSARKYLFRGLDKLRQFWTVKPGN